MSQDHDALHGPAKGHAIVIGASLAGLTAARALARSMDRVTVIERDRLPDDASWRRGVPQSRHAHNLMAAGHQGLEKLFPGLADELLGAGMVRVRMPEDILLLGPKGWMPRFETELSMMTGTRDVIDFVVRQRLLADPKVSFVQEHEVIALEQGQDGAVTGVWARAKDAEQTGGWGERFLAPAEFVVDASGRKSRVLQWLTDLGYGAPEESVVSAKTAYASRVFAPPLGHTADWSCMLLMATPDTPRQGILNPIEGGRWMVSVSASGEERPPTTGEGLLEAAGRLRDSVLRDVIESATPLTPVYGSGRTENRWRHFERMRRWPDRFLVLGDALGAFNPSYGQGMSVAVQSAQVLEEQLRTRGSVVGLADSMRQALARTLAPAWQLASSMDLSYPWAAEAAPPSLADRLGKKYMDRIAAAAVTNHDAARLLIEMTMLLAPPTAAFRPRVLAAAVRGPRGVVPAGPPSSTHGPDVRRRTPRTPAAGDELVTATGASS